MLTLSPSLPQPVVATQRSCPIIMSRSGDTRLQRPQDDQIAACCYPFFSKEVAGEDHWKAHCSRVFQSCTGHRNKRRCRVGSQTSIESHLQTLISSERPAEMARLRRNANRKRISSRFWVRVRQARPIILARFRFVAIHGRQIKKQTEVSAHLKKTRISVIY